MIIAGKEYRKIYLASQSAGRRGIVTPLCDQVVVCPTDCDEHGQWENPAMMVQNLAERKMKAFMESGKYEDKSAPAIASDTVVVIDGSVIGKAKDEKDAVRQLNSLSGRTHQVYSSYAVCIPGHGVVSGYDVANVTFNDITDVIDNYIASHEWVGAAGSYRIQGIGASLIKCIDGDLNTVIGLPLMRIKDLTV